MSISLTAAMADPKLPGGPFQSEIRYTHAPAKKIRAPRGSCKYVQKAIRRPAKAGG